jgi:mannose-6-phosphate isomerase-like protein (cupin superfamily)
MLAKQISVIRPEDVPALSMREGRIESRRLVTMKRDGSERMSFHVNRISAGNRSTGVVYPEMDEINYMVKGAGTIVYDGRRERVTEGMVWNIPAGCAYDFENDVDIVIVSVFSPPRE